MRKVYCKCSLGGPNMEHVNGGYTYTLYYLKHSNQLESASRDP